MSRFEQDDVARGQTWSTGGAVGTIEARLIAPPHLGWPLFLSVLVLLSLMVAATSLWLVLLHPAAVAQAIGEGTLSTFLLELARTLPRTIRGLGEMSAVAAWPVEWPGSLVLDPPARGPRVPDLGPLLLVVFGVRMMFRSRAAVRESSRRDQHVD